MYTVDMIHGGYPAQQNFVTTELFQAEVFPKSYSSSIQLLAAAIGWLRPQTGHEVAEAGTSDYPKIPQVLEKLPTFEPCWHMLALHHQMFVPFSHQATVPPEVKGAMTALQRCAKGSTPLATWKKCPRGPRSAFCCTVSASVLGS